jgi:thymidylate synthase
MGNGFPLLTTKKMPFRNIASELEFFIKGLTDKHWLQERNNHIWDEWANPEKA